MSPPLGVCTPDTVTTAAAQVRPVGFCSGARVDRMTRCSHLRCLVTGLRPSAADAHALGTEGLGQHHPWTGGRDLSPETELPPVTACHVPPGRRQRLKGETGLRDTWAWAPSCFRCWSQAVPVTLPDGQPAKRPLPLASRWDPGAAEPSWPPGFPPLRFQNSRMRSTWEPDTALRRDRGGGGRCGGRSPGARDKQQVAARGPRDGDGVAAASGRWETRRSRAP